MFNNLGTGGLLSPYDQRDYQVTDYLPGASPLPAYYDLRGSLSPVRNQGSEGTCTAFALVASMMDYQQQALPSPDTGAPDKEVLSPRDIYEGGRAMAGLLAGPSGMWPRVGLEYARKTGVCLEIDRPYMAEVKTVPSASAAANRERNKLSAYASVNIGVQSIKEAVRAFGPLVVVLRTTSHFDQARANEVVPFDANQTQGFLHSVSIVGWDDTRNAWILRNSWGEGWADKGHALLSYDWKFLEAWSSVPETALKKKPEGFWAWLLSIFGIK